MSKYVKQFKVGNEIILVKDQEGRNLTNSVNERVTVNAEAIANVKTRLSNDEDTIYSVRNKANANEENISALSNRVILAEGDIDDVADSVVFHDLSNNRIKDVNFMWDEVLNFDGNTGPYVQYTYARCCGVLEKNPETLEMKAENNFVITEDAEAALIKTLKLFPDKVESARKELEPSFIARYLLDVCADFNRFYHDCPVLKCEDKAVKDTRIALVKATSIVLKNGLTLIGLKTPKNI